MLGSRKVGFCHLGQDEKSGQVGLFQDGNDNRSWLTFNLGASKELLQSLINVGFAAPFAYTDADDLHDNFEFCDSENDSISLTNGSHTSISGQDAAQRHSLLVRIVSQLVDSFSNLALNASVGNLL